MRKAVLLPGLKHFMLLILLTCALPCFANVEKPVRNAQEERSSWYTILRWPAAYEKSYEAAGLKSHSGLSFYHLSEDLILVEIQTYLGAYQPGQIYMLYHQQKREVHLLQLPMLALSQDGQRRIFTREEISGYADFDKESKSLRIYSKYRGVGGCGRYGTWTFSEDGVQLRSMREQDCDTADSQNENMILDPQQFPLIWPLLSESS